MKELLAFIEENKNCLNIAFNRKKVTIKYNDNFYMLFFRNNADFSDIIVRQCNGCIFERGTNKLLYYLFEKAYEGYKTQGSNDSFNEDLDSKYSVEKYTEGSIIKLFFYGEEWHMATSKHLDASKNFWTSKKSFKNLFIDAIEASGNTYHDFLSNLDKDHCYSFLIQHPDLYITEHIQAPLIKKININNITTLIETRYVNEVVDMKIDELDTNENYIILKRNNEHGDTRIKVMNETYLKKVSFRSVPDVRLVYLSSTNDKKKEMLELYPEFVSLLTETEYALQEFISDVYKVYVGKYIKHEEGIVYDKSYRSVLYDIHCRYKLTRRPIQLKDVSEIVNNYDTRRLSSLLKK